MQASVTASFDYLQLVSLSLKVPKEPFKLLLQYMEGLRGAARDRIKNDADEIVLLNGGFTQAEREAKAQEDREVADAATEANTAANAAAGSGSATEGGGVEGGSGTAAKGGEGIKSTSTGMGALDAKEASRLKEFRLLRAKKALLALAVDDESEESDSN